MTKERERERMNEKHPREGEGTQEYGSVVAWDVFERRDAQADDLSLVNLRLDFERTGRSLIISKQSAKRKKVKVG